MENRKLGMLMIAISMIFGLFLIYFSFALNERSGNMGCNPTDECRSVGSFISMINIAFGFFGFMLGLGFYILFFNKTEELILRRLEDVKNKEIQTERFNIVLTALDDYEKKVLQSVKEQEGITQNTLRLRTNFSKAKLSYVLQELEKRNLVRRVPKGKTLEVYSNA